MRHCLIVGCLLLGVVWSAPAVAGNQITGAELEALRVAGTTEIAPDDVVTEVKVCITAKGKVKSVKVLASSGVAASDAEIERTVKETWRFRPYKRKKKAVAVCTTTALTFPQPPVPPPATAEGAAPATDKPQLENVSQAAIEAVRISGNKNIVPDEATKVEIQIAGKHRLVIPVKFCLNEAGVVRRVKILKSSGFPAFDRTIKATIETWVYQPFLIDGIAKPVCSAIVLIYVQR